MVLNVWSVLKIIIPAVEFAFKIQPKSYKKLQKM